MMEKSHNLGDRSRTFWHGVDAIVEIQKSSEIDTENYSISAAPKERSTDEEIETVIKSNLFCEIEICSAVISLSLNSLLPFFSFI